VVKAWSPLDEPADAEFFRANPARRHRIRRAWGSEITSWYERGMISCPPRAKAIDP
jgi:hypothetical protein